MTAWALVVLFAIHLLAFAVLAVKRRQARYVRLVILFAALVGHYAMRATGVDAPLGPTTVATALRVLALILAVWSVADFLLRRLRRSRGSTRG